VRDAYRVDLVDDDDPPEVIVHCPGAAREFGGSRGREARQAFED